MPHPVGYSIFEDRGKATKADIEKLLKQVAFDRFDVSGDWPPVSEVHREALKRNNDLELPFADVLQFFSKHSGAYSTDAPTSLNVRDLSDVAGTELLLSQFIQMVRLCVQKFGVGQETPKISSLDLRTVLGFQDLTVRKMKSLLDREFVLTRSGGGDRTEWAYDIAPDIHLFRKVSDVPSYLAVLDRIARPDAGRDAFVPHLTMRDQGRGMTVRDLQTRNALVAGQPSGPATGPGTLRRVFVLMPFRPQWSKRVYKMIKGCCNRAQVPCGRADEITSTGKITEQIIQAIANADIVIADITRTNANVLYELGFAHANAKKVIVMNQGASSPFDVNDWRQIRYKAKQLNPASRMLSQFLQSAIEELNADGS